ncbi:MAG: radical SAM protein [Aquificaceae bacterium]
MKLLRELSSELNRLFLFELFDQSRIEAVFYRDTLCISTQVGCAIACPFCLSGKLGLFRNLTLEEILDQCRLLRDRVNIRRIAIAGIGEPLMNWERVKEAFWYFKGLGLKVSFYTTGYPLKNLRELLGLPHGGVNISLHSTEERKRKKLLPHAGSLKDLIDMLKGELPLFSRRKGKRISLAYLLLKGVNDSTEELTHLAKLAKGLGLGITLLRYNSTTEGYQDVGDEDYERVFLLLRSYGIRVTLSTRFRKDRVGACGTLLVNRSLIEC